MMSELGRETVSAYAAAKGGLKMLTRNICSEYGEANIQCNGIGPGYIATPRTAPLRERQPDGSRHPFDQFIIAKTPAGRWGTPEDLICRRLPRFRRFQLRQRPRALRRRRHSRLHRQAATVRSFPIYRMKTNLILSTAFACAIAAHAESVEISVLTPPLSAHGGNGGGR